MKSFRVDMNLPKDTNQRTGRPRKMTQVPNSLASPCTDWQTHCLQAFTWRNVPCGITKRSGLPPGSGPSSCKVWDVAVPLVFMCWLLLVWRSPSWTPTALVSCRWKTWQFKMCFILFPVTFKTFCKWRWASKFKFYSEQICAFYWWIREENQSILKKKSWYILLAPTRAHFTNSMK